jgi:hypothetical protein
MRGIRGGPGIVDGCASLSGWLSVRLRHEEGGGAGIVSAVGWSSRRGGNGVDARRASSVGGAGSVIRSSAALVSHRARTSEWSVGWSRLSSSRRAGATGFMVRACTT